MRTLEIAGKASVEIKTAHIRVLLVDDHQVVLEGLQRIFELDKGIEVVGEARNGQEAISKALRLYPDVVIMELKMPGMDGITAIRELKQKLPKVSILVLTLYAGDFIEQAIEAGASGYLLKDTSSKQITTAVHQVYDGLCPIDPSLTRQLVVELVGLSRANRSTILTGRQLEILRGVRAGMKSSDIASHLIISNSTVKRELRQILDKLQANSRTHAITEAIRRKLI
jgi:DNA-binding NarL/FixJ family response regulator